MDDRMVLAGTVVKICAWVETQGYTLPVELKAFAILHNIRAGIKVYLRDTALKTQAHYEMVIKQAVKDFYNGEIDGFGFIDRMVSAITEQFTRAWNEGMREVGLDPAQDMEPEWEDVLAQAIADEIDNVQAYASDIEQAASDKENKPIDPLLARVPMWSNRYPEMVNMAKTTCGGKVKLEWIYGDTDHCDTCASLNGVVAFAEEWDQAGLHPQGAPNDRLECGGWRCQCRLESTKKRRTANVMDVLLNVGLRL